MSNCVEADAASSGEAYHSLQARQQALQASLAEHSLQSSASQHSMQQQTERLQAELTAVKQERDAAVMGLKALQMCEDKSKCSLHVGLSQVSLLLLIILQRAVPLEEQAGLMLLLQPFTMAFSVIAHAWNAHSLWRSKLQQVQAG